MSTKLWLLLEGHAEWSLYHSGTAASCFEDWELLSSGQVKAPAPIMAMRIEWHAAEGASI